MANHLFTGFVAASLAAAALAIQTVHVVGAADITGDGVTLALGSVDVSSGKTEWRKGSLLPDGASFCIGGFVQQDPASALYYAVSTSAVVTYNVTDGSKIRSVPLSLPYDLVIGGVYSSDDADTDPAGERDALIWGVGSIGDGPFDVISINTTTGKVEKVVTNMKYGSLGNCEGATAAGVGVGGAAFWFETDGPDENTDLLVRFDLSKKSYSAAVPHAGMISTVSSWIAAPSPDGSSLVAVLSSDPAFVTYPDAGLILASVNDTINTELASVDAATGTVTHLLMLNTSYSAQQGKFSYDPSTGLAYAVLQGPHSLVTYSLATFNLTATPPTATYVHIPDGDNSKYGIFNPTVLH